MSTQHSRTETFESVGVFSGEKFYRATCSCGWAGLDERDASFAAQAFRRHAAQQTAEIAA